MSIREFALNVKVEFYFLRSLNLYIKNMMELLFLDMEVRIKEDISG